MQITTHTPRLAMLWLLSVITLFMATPLVAAHADVSSTIVTTYTYPRVMLQPTAFAFRANGREVTVYQTSAGPFAAFSCNGSVDIEIDLPQGNYSSLTVSPLKNGISHRLEGTRLSFQIPGPMLLAVMVDLEPIFYIYANPPANNTPQPSDADVLFFKAGQVYEVGDLELQSNQTLYIEGGAVVRGALHAAGQHNIRIAGYGILDGSYFKAPGQRRSILLENCKNSLIEDIIMIEPTSWMIVLGLCDSIVVRNIKQLGFVTTSDGIDIVGSRHIRVENSFLRNGDDCVAIKSFDLSSYDRKASMDYSRDVYDIEVTGCIMISYLGGHAFEIGHELTTDKISNIRFRDCDVLGIHGHGGVFGINNSDRALVTDILYEDIRIEHYYNKLVNLRVIKSRFHHDEKRGQVRNITFRNIDVTNSPYNPGYSTSVIGGYDARHTVENVIFENLRINGVKVTNGDQMDLFTKQAKRIVFR